MTIVTEYDWESDTWMHHTGENAARAAWREAIQEIAEKAKATLPEQRHGRVPPRQWRVQLQGLCEGTLALVQAQNCCWRIQTGHSARTAQTQRGEQRPGDCRSCSRTSAS
jgi:hypothetical protein